MLLFNKGADFTPHLPFKYFNTSNVTIQRKEKNQ